MQLDTHASLASRFPSSHSSPGSTMPLPQRTIEPPIPLLVPLDDAVLEEPEEEEVADVELEVPEAPPPPLKVLPPKSVRLPHPSSIASGKIDSVHTQARRSILSV